MKKIPLILAAVFGFACLTVAANDKLPLEVRITPHTINLSANGNWVTVHTDLSCELDPVSSPDQVTLEGIPADFIECDDEGYLVAKIPADAVRDFLGNLSECESPWVELTVAIVDDGGDNYEGSGQVRVTDPPHKHRIGPSRLKAKVRPSGRK